MDHRLKVFIHLLTLIAICYFVFFFRMGAHDLWNPDEPRYAQVAREMLESDDWVVPHLNGEVYTEKPPLYFWLVALASRPFGDVTEVSARLPSAAATTLAVLLAYVLGMIMLGEREAFLGALVLATSAQILVSGRAGVIDPLLMLCILASLTLFFLAYVSRHEILYTAGFLFLAPAALSKGPVGIAVPLVVMLLFLFVEILLRKEGAGRQLAWFALGSLLGLMVLAFIVVPWWKVAYDRSGGVYGSLSILTKQTSGRILHSYVHRRPFYYYFIQVFWQFLPWTIFLPLAIQALRRKETFRKNVGVRFLCIWFLGVFLFFSCVSGKRSQYIMPLMPAGGLLLGWAIATFYPERGKLRDRREFSLPVLLLLVVCLGGLIGIVAATYWYLPEHLVTAVAGFSVVAVALALAYPRMLNRPPADALKLIVTATTIVVVVIFGFGGRTLDKFKSARPFCNDVLAALHEGDDLRFYRCHRPNVQFYLHRNVPRLNTNEEVAASLGNGSHLILILQKKEEDRLEEGVAQDLFKTEEVFDGTIGNRELVCVKVLPADRHRPGERVDSKVISGQGAKHG